MAFSGDCEYTDPFEELLCYLGDVKNAVDDVISCGINFDGIGSRLSGATKIIVEREFYEHEFPNHTFAYAPIKSEVKTIMYNTSETLAFEVIADLFDVLYVPEAKEIITTTYNYEIKPPVAILNSVNSVKKECRLKIPNMDNNFTFSHDYNKYLFVPITHFQTSIFCHALAYLMIKYYSYECASLLINSLNPVDYIIREIKNIDELDSTNKESYINKYINILDEYKSFSYILNSVITSIKNVTGISNSSVSAIIKKVANFLEDEDIIEQMNNQKALYDNVKNNLPSGKLVMVDSEIENITYTPVNDMTLVSKKTISLSAQGRKIQKEEKYKISKNTVFQVIPLLRERIDTSKLSNSYSSELGISSKHKLNISLPTTSWDDAKQIRMVFSSIKYNVNTLLVKCESIDELFSLVEKFSAAPMFSMSYNAIAGQCSISLTYQTLTSE